MDIVEIEQKETVSRKEVATRLRKLATMLAKGNEIPKEEWPHKPDGELDIYTKPSQLQGLLAEAA